MNEEKAPNLYQLGANDNEKETLIDCTSASAVFFYQIKSFVSILEDESARFLRSVKATPTLIETGERPESFLGSSSLINLLPSIISSRKYANLR